MSTTASLATAGETGRLRIPSPVIPLSRPEPKTVWVLAAFGAVYLIWGSTYLAMHVAISTMPPFLMAGTRFALAGLLLYGFARARGAARPTRIHWRSALLVGGLLLVVGNGGVAWAQQYVPTSVTALMVAATPLWMAVVEWLRPGGQAPRWQVTAGLLLGFAGVALIVFSKHAGGEPVVRVSAAVVLLAAPLCWSLGSIYSRHAPQSSSSLLNIGMQMFCGGLLMLGCSLALGEWHGFHISHISSASWWAFAYLLVFGSLIAFSAYIWLLQVSTPARVSTYAYVNPLIAVALGAWILHEPFPFTVVLAGLLILAAVALTLAGRNPVPAK